MDNQWMPETLWVFRESDDSDQYVGADDELYTHKDTDTRYEKVGDDLVGTALRLLTEAGYHVEINVTKKEDAI